MLPVPAALRGGGQPRRHRRRLARPVVVDHEVDGKVLLNAAIDAFEEADELVGTLARLILADGETGLHIEGSEQRLRAVAIVVMRPGRGAALLQGHPDCVRSGA